MNEENAFLPTDYSVPESPSNYMRFQEGINRFRVLGSAVTGYEYFTKDNKPVRSREPFESVPSDIKQGGKIKVFWAFPAWNYQTKTVQVLEITQKGIMNAMTALLKNPKWGSPFKYDIAVTRTGDGMETEYQVQAEPPISEIPDEIKAAYMDKPIRLEALFEGKDPFEVAS